MRQSIFLAVTAVATADAPLAPAGTTIASLPTSEREVARVIANQQRQPSAPKAAANARHRMTCPSPMSEPPSQRKRAFGTLAPPASCSEEVRPLEYVSAQHGVLETPLHQARGLRRPQTVTWAPERYVLLGQCMTRNKIRRRHAGQPELLARGLLGGGRLDCLAAERFLGLAHRAHKCCHFGRIARHRVVRAGQGTIQREM